MRSHIALALLLVCHHERIAFGVNLRAGATSGGFAHSEDALFWDRSFVDERFQSVMTPSPTASSTPPPASTPGPTPGTSTPVPTAVDTSTPVPTSGDTPTPEPTSDIPTPVPTATETSTPAPVSGSETPVPTAVPTSDTPAPTSGDAPTSTPTSDTASPAPTTSDTDSPVPTTSDTDSPAPMTPDTDSPLPTTSDTDSPAPTTSDTDSPVPTTSDTDSPLPTTSDPDSPAPTTSDTDSPLPTTSDTDSPAPTTSDTDSPLPTTSDTDSPAPTAFNTDSPAPSTSDTDSPVPTMSDTGSSQPTTSDTESPVPTTSDTVSPLPTTSDTASPVPTSDNSTPAPTSGASPPSPAPTPSSPSESCVLEATVECTLDNNSTCSDLELIPEEDLTCVLPNGPTELGWIYRGTNCDDSNADLECMDINGGPNMDPLVNILVENADGEEVFRETGVTLDESFLIPSDDGAALDDEISIVIYTGGDETDGVLQVMSGIQTGCSAGDNLTLGTNYGALEFISYRDDDEFIQAVQPVEWRYAVTSVATPDAFLSVVLSITNGETVITTPNVLLEKGESYSFNVPSEISLISPGNYTGEVSAAATSVESDQIECGASASNTVVLS